MTNSFKDRLKRLHDAHRRGRDTDDGPRGVYTAADADEAAAEDLSQPGQGYGWEQLGARKTTRYGDELWIAKQVRPDRLHHRNEPPGDDNRVSYRRLAELDDEPPGDVSRGDLLYMDTETTGLGPDAFAFMLGVGYFSEKGDFVVEQLLIDEPSDEPALLRGFADRLADHRVLVTFNGIRFDVPLLQRRFAHHEIDCSLSDSPHLDLLPMSRRCFPGLSNYRLTNLERNVLEFERIDDIPGRDIPEKWWKFQKNRSAELMAPVLEHNRHDIVSLELLVAAAVDANSTEVHPDELEQNIATGRPGLRSRRPDGSNSPGRDTTGSDGSTSRVAQALERTYRLRGKFARDSDTPAGSAPSPSRRDTEPATAPERSGDGAVGRRTDKLESAARALIDEGMWREASPLLFELVALVPDHPWGLETLAEWYRRDGRSELAEQLEARGGSRR